MCLLSDYCLFAVVLMHLQFKLDFYLLSHDLAQYLQVIQFWIHLQYVTTSSTLNDISHTLNVCKSSKSVLR